MKLVISFDSLSYLTNMADADGKFKSLYLVKICLYLFPAVLPPTTTTAYALPPGELPDLPPCQRHVIVDNSPTIKWIAVDSKLILY